MAIGKLRTNLAWSLSAYAFKLCAHALLFYGSLWNMPGWQIYTRVISPPNISASILVFLKCRKELPSLLTLTGMLVQLFPEQSSRLIVWTIRICFWMMLFPLSLSDPP